MSAQHYTVFFEELGIDDIVRVGGKNASLGEMIKHLSALGVRVPQGFATTAQAFRDFLQQNNLEDAIHEKLKTLNPDDIKALNKIGADIRQMIEKAAFSPAFLKDVETAYQALCKRIQGSFTVAVRSSATAEDLPDASFAGQQETYLNVASLDDVLHCIKKVYASLYNDRAIAYRVHHAFEHQDVAISVGVQQMIRSDLGASGVLFTLDTESGFSDVVFITSSYGLGEMVVQGAVNPDEFYLYKPNVLAKKPAVLRRNLGQKALKMVYADKSSAERVQTVAVPEDLQICFSLNDEELNYLAAQALIIESHYKRPMDIEWAKDGATGDIYILQARPETVKSQKKHLHARYKLGARGQVLAEGRSIGQKIGQGTARVLSDISEMDALKPGDVLVTDMTDPDWEPIMKRASAIVTNRGGRTCHAAIIARELGIPAVVGCGDATKTIAANRDVTVSCAEGDAGFIYDGLLPFTVETEETGALPDLGVDIMLNVGNPERAFAFQSVPNKGVGLARLEFLISNTIGIHPKALLEFDALEDKELKAKIAHKTKAYPSPVAYYVERLREGIATIAAAFYPKPVIVRLSDFKSNEYANLLGGHLYEPHEENPMLGFRGASRYASPEFAACFALECQAVRAVREDMGLDNVEVMIPFVRTPAEAKGVIETLKTQGLERGKQGLRLIMMCEIPSNALQADAFLQYFDGFSIGSNDLTQLTLGLDRDSGLVAKAFDERDPAVKMLISMAIKACKAQGKYIGICGQGPSDHPDLALWLKKEGIDSMSLNPDSVLQTAQYLTGNQA